MGSMKPAIVVVGLVFSGCGSPPPLDDAAHTQNPEMQQCLGDSGYRDVPGRAQENVQIELKCRELLDLRHKQH